MTKYGLNGATTMPVDQAREIRLVGAAGFHLIEFRVPKVEKFLQTGTLADLKEMLDAAGIKALSMNSIEQVNTRPAGGTKALHAECKKLASWAQALSCPYLVAVPGFLSEPVSEKEMIARTVDALAPLAEIVAAHQVRLAFEFLGFSHCSVSSLPMAREVVRRLGRPSVGLVIDTFHFFLSGAPLERLAEIAPGELFLFHVNDAEDQPRHKLADEHRVLPGQGVIPLKKIWEVLQQHGLIDHASLELFRPHYWHLPPEKLLGDGLASMQRIFR